MVAAVAVQCHSLFYVRTGRFMEAGGKYFSQFLIKEKKIEDDFEKTYYGAALVAVMAGVITGCGSKKNDSNVAKNSGDTFTVGFDAEFPPYGYKDDSGEYVGFDLDLAAEVCSRNGWTLVKQPIEWESKDMELNSGMIDCIWNGFTMDGREKEYTWSTAYVDNSQVVL